jgi:hypothetical protein
MINLKRVVATIRKGNRNAVVVTVGRHGRHSYIDIRQYEPDGLRVLKPTRSGIGRIDRMAARELITAIEIALAQIEVWP